MRRSIAVVSACFIIAVPACLAYAGSSVFSLRPQNKRPWRYSIGAEISHITYSERQAMREKGIMYGLSQSLTYRSGLMLELNGRFSFGDVDYESTESGLLDNINDSMVEVRFLGGYDFLTRKNVTVTPYLGIGYRYLNDNSNGMVTNVGDLGYERESNYVYSPIGMDLVFPLNSGISLGFTGEYDQFWYGMQRSHLSDVHNAFQDIENTQREGNGWRASARITKETSTVDLSVETFIRWWNISESDTSDIMFANVLVGYGYEPSNKSVEYGVKLTGRY